ncbi:tetratricopeptide repeat protein [candidate division KSB1 bacterium]
MNFTTISFLKNHCLNSIFLIAVFLIILSSCTGSKQTAVNSGPTEAELEQQRIEEIKRELQKYWSFGGTAYQQGNFDDALRYLELAKELDMKMNGDESAYPAIYKFLGATYQHFKRHDEAIIEFERFLKFDPEDVNTNEILLHYYIQNKDLEKYIEKANIVIPLFKNNPVRQKGYITSLKNVYRQLGRYEEALEVVNRLLELDPDNKELADERIGLLKMTGGSEAVKTDLEEKAKQYPDDLSYKWELVQIYEDESDHEKALTMLDQILAIQKDDTDVLERKLRIYWDQMQDVENALNVLNKLSELKPDEPEYIGTIAQIKYENGKLQEAVSICERAIAIDSTYGRAWYYMAKSVHDYADNVVRGEGGEQRYQDKLVYQLAFGWYSRAAKDPSQRVAAERYAKYLGDNFIPTGGDIFLHKGEGKPADPKYRWLLKFFKDQ